MIFTLYSYFFWFSILNIWLNGRGAKKKKNEWIPEVEPKPETGLKFRSYHEAYVFIKIMQRKQGSKFGDGFDNAGGILGIFMLFFLPDGRLVAKILGARKVFFLGRFWPHKLFDKGRSPGYYCHFWIHGFLSWFQQKKMQQSSCFLGVFLETQKGPSLAADAD